MPKKFIKRFMPEPHRVKEHKHLQFLGDALHNPSLWHLNRRSVSIAFAIGLFMAMMPMPFQMIPAAVLAIVLRANLLLSVALVWISNPITMPPIFYFSYKVGAAIIGRQGSNFAFEVSWQWLSTELAQVWQPFLLGCFVVGIVLSITGYFTIQGLWRLHVVREWEKRKLARQMRKNKTV